MHIKSADCTIDANQNATVDDMLWKNLKAYQDSIQQTITSPPPPTQHSQHTQKARPHPHTHLP